jgi:putative intracellular protease/amidase
MTILIPTGTYDVDPTEVAVPWHILHERGHDICFATDTGKAASADPIMLSGDGLGFLKPLLIAEKPARETYAALLQDKAFQNPIHYDDIRVEDYEAILLPGGHAKGAIPYLESTVLQKAIAGFFAAGKPIAAICHGVVAVCRAENPETGKSVLYGRKTTALLRRQERLAYHVTKHKVGDYYLTYPVTVEDEVTATLKSPDDFIQGPMPVLRDNMKHLSRGFTVRDGNYLSARWPGDVHKFALEFAGML